MSQKKLLDPGSLQVGMPSSAYGDLKDLHLLRDEVSSDDPSLSEGDWLSFNQKMEEVAEAGSKTASPQAYDHVASGKAAAVNLTDIVEKFLTIDGKPFRFDGRHYMKGIFDYVPDFAEGCKNLIIVSSRQIGKSSSQAAKSAALGILYPSYKTLAVAPRYDQVVVFSQQRFNPMCLNSELMMKTFVNPNRNLWQVKAKQFTNGSFFNFRSCYLSADGARGISADHLMIDEIQDLVPDSVPILESCQDHSPRDRRYNLYTGTPKSSANVLNLRYQDSCMFEWLVKCPKCRYSDNECDESIIAEDAYRCVKCHGLLNPNLQGRWVPRRPALLNKRWGFKISQIMTQHKTWEDIVAKRDDPNVSKAAYMNEVLGLPYDDGAMGITDEILQKACKDYHMIQPRDIKAQYADRGYRVYAGVDYGSGEGSNPSYTVLTIGAMMRTGIFKVLYMKKFKGQTEVDSINQLNMIDNFCRQAGVSWLGADWGFGAHQNLRLEREKGWNRTGNSNVIMEFKYVTSKKELVWNGKHYHVDRNQSMSRAIDAVRNPDEENGITFFNYGEFGDFKLDLTTIYLEYNERTGNTSYQHQLPDDAFHSINYAYVAARRGSGLDDLNSGYFSVTP